MQPKRITNAEETDNRASGGKLRFIAPEYSSVCPFNADNSRLILVHESYFGLYDGDGAYLKDLPFEINASSEPRWSRLHPNVLYYHEANALKSIDVATGEIRIVRQFAGYKAITSFGECDLNASDCIALCGDNRAVFVFDIPNTRKFSSLNVKANVESLYLADDGSLVVSWVDGGIELFRDGVSQRKLLNANSHKDLCVGALIASNSNENPVTLPDFPNGVIAIDLATGKQEGLLSLPWSASVHVSCPDTGYAFITTESTQEPDLNQILRIDLATKAVKVLCDHGSRITDYTSQPRASVSRDGSRLVYASNAAGAVDTYLLADEQPVILGHYPLIYEIIYATGVNGVPRVTVGGQDCKVAWYGKVGNVTQINAELPMGMAVDTGVIEVKVG